MSTTVYTFHAAGDHSIIAAFEWDHTVPNTLGYYAEQQAKADAALIGKTTRYYAHNGTGVIAAFLTRDGVATQILRDDYRKFDAKAKQLRIEADIHVD
jgi:hypothetical protein